LLAFVPSAQADEQVRCDNRTSNSLRKLLECVTLPGVLEHEQAFQAIADANNGTRYSGSSGYDESIDYVEERLTRAGYDVTRQAFEFFSF
jgi:hypothetical protein